MNQELQRDSNNNNTKKRQRHRGAYIKYCIVILILIFVYNNYTLKVTKQEVTSSKVNDTIKIAVISDYHSSYVQVPNIVTYNAIANENPDMVFFLGDMYTNGSSDKLIQQSIDFMGHIYDMGYLCYFVSGEHDNDEDYFQALEDVGVNVLHYETDTVTIKGTTITLYGIDNVYFSDTFDLHNAFDSPNPDEFTILLAHIPMYDYYQNFGTDLTVCGDTHGGLIQIPYLGCIYYEGEFFPELKRDPTEIRDKGLFAYDGGNLFITSGLGNNPLPVRFNNRPEVAIIEVTPEE